MEAENLKEEMKSFVYDGHQYKMEENGDVINVYGMDEKKWATATRHSAFEDVSFEYYDEMGDVIGEGSLSDLYNYSNETLATWLMGTYPSF